MQSIRERLRQYSRGQIIIMVALLFPIFIGMTGLAIDGAVLFSERRQMQAAADIAALAGSIDLPDNSAAAIAAANANASTNGYTSGVTPISPYAGDIGKIEVTITESVDTFFMGFFGIDSVDVTARAVAIHDTGEYAIFASESDCPPNNEETIHWGGSDAIVHGDVHSNAGIKVSGSDNQIIGRGTFVCDDHISGSDNTFTDGLNQGGQKASPVNYTKADFLPCTFTNNKPKELDLAQDGPFWKDGQKDSKQLMPGVYCADGTLKLSGSDISGTVTFYATEAIHVSGSNFDLKPFKNDTLMFSDGNKADTVKISGSGGTWEGLLYAPNGQVDISGSGNFSVHGTIVANTVKLSGSDWGIIGTLDSSRDSQLIE